RAHAVLADVSIGYPPLQGRFPRATHPCATKPPGEPNSLVRLACVKHAASVRSEPGSNSHVHPVALTSNSRLRAHDSAHAAARASLPTPSPCQSTEPRSRRCASRPIWRTGHVPSARNLTHGRGRTTNIVARPRPVQDRMSKISAVASDQPQIAQFPHHRLGRRLAGELSETGSVGRGIRREQVAPPLERPERPQEGRYDLGFRLDQAIAPAAAIPFGVQGDDTLPGSDLPADHPKERPAIEHLLLAPWAVARVNGAPAALRGALGATAA